MVWTIGLLTIWITSVFQIVTGYFVHFEHLKLHKKTNIYLTCFANTAPGHFKTYIDDFQVKLVEAEEKITSLGHELDSVKSELKTNCEKMNFDQKKFGTVNETLKEQLDQATEKIEQVYKFLINKNKYKLCLNW